MKGPFTLILCLVRHGETIANREDILQGQCDYPLTEEGVGDALLVGDFLGNVDWDLTFTSDLKRAKTTAEILLSRHKNPSLSNRLVDLPLIRERSFGVRETLSRTLTHKEAVKIVSERLGIPKSEVVDTAETADALLERQREFVKYLKLSVRTFVETAASDVGVCRVLCVSHGAFIRSFLSNLHKFGNLLSRPLGEVAKIANCSVTILKLCWKDVGDLIRDSGAESDFEIVVEEDMLNFTRHIETRGGVSPLQL